MSDFRVLVAAYGDPQCNGQAFETLVYHELQRREIAGVEVFGPHAERYALADRLNGQDALLILDSARCMSQVAAPLLDTDFSRPSHNHLNFQFGTYQCHKRAVEPQLELARRLGRMPQRVRLLAAMFSLAYGSRPSFDNVLAAVPEAVRRVERYVARWRREAELRAEREPAPVDVIARLHAGGRTDIPHSGTLVAAEG